MALPTGSDPKIARRMRSVKHIVIVLSGKGGVGKSSVAAQLALSLSSTSSTSATGGARVGILDLDLTGPSIPRMLGLDGQSVRQSSDGWVPVYADREQRLAVMSTGFLLRNRNDSVVWRGPKKNAMVRQFLADVRWGDLDYLVIDTPPGTSDEHISLLEYLRGYNPCAVMVTTPQAVSLADNLRSLDFTRKTSLPLLGLIENMSGYVCPHCTECTNVWGRGGGEALAEREGIHFLGRIPIDPGLVRVLDDAKEEAIKSSGDAATALERINERLSSLKDTRQHAAADASAASSQADQLAVTEDVKADEPAAVLAGTTLSRTLIQRYRESQTFPVFQSITREIISLADERQTTATLAAISVS